MTLSTRIALWAFVVIFAAAPSLAIAAAECASHCCPPAPCYEAPDDCEGMLGTMWCCDAAPTTVPSVAKRAPHPPAHQPALAICSISIAEPARARPPASAAHQGVLTSPLRLSVVMLI